jgi:hypothetical protein
VFSVHFHNFSFSAAAAVCAEISHGTRTPFGITAYIFLCFFFIFLFFPFGKKKNKIKGNLERTRSFQCEHPWRIIAVEFEGNVYDFKQNVFFFFFFSFS